MKLRKGQQVEFKAIDDLTGQALNLSGIVISEAYRYIQAHRDLQSEYGGIKSGEAYIIRVKGNSQSEQLHLVFPENILE